MSNRSFKKSSLFVVYVFVLLDIVLLQGSPAPATTPQSISYYRESTDGVLGVRIAFDPKTDTAMKIIISYDTVVPVSSIPFFTQQLNEKTFAAFSKCDSIAWTFLPCSTSKMDNSGQLACNLGKNQCTYDEVHSCVATSLKNDQKRLGSFIICSFAGITTQQRGVDQCRFDQIHGCLDDAFNWHQDTMGKFLKCVYTPGKSCEDCNTQEGGLVPEDMKACVGSARGATSCNGSHNDFVNAKTKPKTQTEIDNSKNLPNAITDFKACTCKVLGQIKLKCDTVCTGLY